MFRPARFPPIACPCGEALQERPLTLYDDGEQGLRKLIFARLQWKLERDTGQAIKWLTEKINAVQLDRATANAYTTPTNTPPPRPATSTTTILGITTRCILQVYYENHYYWYYYH